MPHSLLSVLTIAVMIPLGAAWLVHVSEYVLGLPVQAALQVSLRRLTVGVLFGMQWFVADNS